MSAAQGWSPDKYLNPNTGTVGVSVAMRSPADVPGLARADRSWTHFQGGFDPTVLPPILEGAQT
ncbi:hypothetical protein [Antrihabitans stalactiti]|uniref:Uncharacterized protein n=1 Tax=Antrihabitans stalactiti TaxID=2584121 RepID=A0A848KCM2_9NOCA|nr:hypothetical protein [Antrihabitans stalactiti]NMN96595.1 hypothetical protein [Antrihabitans stalactiti]